MTPCRLALACCALLVATTTVADDKKPLSADLKGQTPMDKVDHLVLTPEMRQDVAHIARDVLELRPLLQIDTITYNTPTTTTKDGGIQFTAYHAWGAELDGCIPTPVPINMFLDFRHFVTGKVGAKLGTGKIEWQVSADPNFPDNAILAHGEMEDQKGVYRLMSLALGAMKSGKPDEQVKNYVRFRRLEPGGKKGPYSNHVIVPKAVITPPVIK